VVTKGYKLQNMSVLVMNLIFNILSNMGNTAKETNEVELQQFAID
jgi:hypothetical protein